jgi:hypothetical protein
MDGAMKPQTDQTHWKMLERNAHRPEIQELVRREIRSGTIRVVPGLKGGIRIIPIDSAKKTADPAREADKDPHGAGYTAV